MVLFWTSMMTMTSHLHQLLFALCLAADKNVEDKKCIMMFRSFSHSCYLLQQSTWTCGTMLLAVIGHFILLQLWSLQHQQQSFLYYTGSSSQNSESLSKTIKNINNSIFKQASSSWWFLNSMCYVCPAVTLKLQSLISFSSLCTLNFAIGGLHMTHPTAQPLPMKITHHSSP